MAAAVPPAGDSSSEDLTSSPELAIKNRSMWVHYTQGPIREKRLTKSQKPGEAAKMKRPDRKAICNYCSAPISRTGGTTSNMRSHLQAKHPGHMKELVKAELLAKKIHDREQSDLENAFEAAEVYDSERLRKFIL
jgi:hypothetical protein